MGPVGVDMPRMCERLLITVQIALAFIFYHLKRDEPLYHLGHAGAFISRLSAGHDKGTVIS